MLSILVIVLPVFFVVGVGYVAAWRRIISAEGIDGVMTYAQTFAVPCLLFAAISRIDLSHFDPRLLASYYIGSFSVFFIGYVGARLMFSRGRPDSVAIGFCCLFPNTLLLGLAITESAYGLDALVGNFTIVSIHAPLMYTFGTIAMELVRSTEKSAGPSVLLNIGKSLAVNPLILAVVLGFIVNLTGFSVPEAPMVAIDMLARSALPAALFGLGGVLVRYQPEGDMKAISWITFLSLMVHPAIVYGLSKWAFELSDAYVRSAVVTAAMAPGINTYIFANIYGTAKRVVASSVLIATAVSVLTASFWLAILP